MWVRLQVWRETWRALKDWRGRWSRPDEPCFDAEAAHASPGLGEGL